MSPIIEFPAETPRARHIRMNARAQAHAYRVMTRWAPMDKVSDNQYPQGQFPACDELIAWRRDQARRMRDNLASKPLRDRTHYWPDRQQMQMDDSTRQQLDDLVRGGDDGEVGLLGE